MKKIEIKVIGGLQYFLTQRDPGIGEFPKSMLLVDVHLGDVSVEAWLVEKLKYKRLSKPATIISISASIGEAGNGSKFFPDHWMIWISFGESKTNACYYISQEEFSKLLIWFATNKNI